jgi:iron complex outermembrane recepter protein
MARKNVVPISTAGYNACGWRLVEWHEITLGIQNVFDSDPPFAAVAFGNGYDASLADVKGRFCYVQLKKKF